MDLFSLFTVALVFLASLGGFAIGNRGRKKAIVFNEEAAILNSSPIGVAVSINDIIVYCNARGSLLMGFKEGQSAAKAYSQEYSRKRVLQTLEDSNQGNLEVPHVGQDGVLRMLHLHYSELTQEEDTAKICWIVDVSAAKELEKQILVAKDLAEKASSAKSDFLANISHEIRTPMNGIVGMSHLALQFELDEKLRDYINQIDHSSKTLLRIIDDILDFSKLEAGKLDIEQSVFSVETVLHSVASLVGAEVDHKSLEMLFQIDSAVPARLEGGALRFSQVLLNLVSNAVKFTNAGNIVISVNVREKLPDNQLRLEIKVSDTGVGIDEIRLSRLFQPFSQADTSLTRSHGGTGLGLAISRRLVELMGGEIVAHSKPGKGSCFEFTALFKEVVSQSPSRKRGSLYGHALVVDDNAQSRMLLRDMLEKMSFQVTLADSGVSALELFKKAQEEDQPYSVVLVDWKMPGMDGVEAALKIHEVAHVHPPTMLMVTSHSKDLVIGQAEAAGIAGVLTKPVSPSLLFESLANVIYEGNDSRPSPLRVVVLQDLVGKKILLADDTTINQVVAKEVLEQQKMQVDVVHDALEAIEKAWTGSYDAILMDIQMPGMDGLTATKVLRSEAPHLARTPIIAMTAHALTGDREKSLLAGMQDHVTKPISPVTLQQVLQLWLGPKPPWTE